jgi:hypothetical protein
MKIFITILSLLTLTAAHAQYAPQAGVSGSTAVHQGSPSFNGWATGCVVNRGYVDIADQTQGQVTSGTDNEGAGMADQLVVSLGDSGVATLTFAGSIFNGPGPDFAVFENGFPNPNNAAEAFLELAFVEVSSNGTDFFRFPAHSLTQVDTQIAGAGMFMNASLINNLAGKYRSTFGTPFDLEDLAGTPGLDLDNITHVRLVDVVGAINAGAGSVDTAGNLINDPYPTNFPTGGFDLDAVGVFHQNPVGIKEITSGKTFHIYPNPVSDKLWINSTTHISFNVIVTDVTGKVLLNRRIFNYEPVSLSSYCAGIYYLQLQNEKGEQCVEKIIKQ